MGKKRKLTLSVDEDVIKMANAAGINISRVTEQLLKYGKPPEEVAYRQQQKEYEEQEFRLSLISVLNRIAVALEKQTRNSRPMFD